jgi:hypothetical protein
MTENKDTNIEAQGFLDSKIGKTIMVVLAVFLIFAGPTYIIYGLAVMLKVGYLASFSVGFVLFVVGLVLMWYLAKKKIIS